MNNITRAVGQALFIGLLLLFAVPAGYIAVRIGDTWTAHYTEQVLGWLTAICGGSLLLVALLVGAGFYAKLTGVRLWGRATPPMPPMEAAPLYYLPSPGRSHPIQAHEVEPGAGSRQPFQPPVQTPAHQPPPWGVTGGGRYDLLPPPVQDTRFSIRKG
jgi:hypothetical protein